MEDEISCLCFAHLDEIWKEGENPNKQETEQEVEK
jgi:hypothetical protein